jgi:hypothetical protein
MIRADDRTPEQRRADREAEIQAEITAMTEQEVHDGMQMAIAILGHNGNLKALRAVIASCQKIVDLKERVRELEQAAIDVTAKELAQ